MALPVVVLISFLYLANGYQYQTQCLLFNKKCVSFCPRQMHPYHTRCDRNTVSQRTCDSPHIFEIGYTCGWSRCDCNGELVLDEDTGDCITLESCPSKFHKTRKGRRRRRKPRKPYGLSRQLRIHEDDDNVDKMVL
ncbi:uncharacterized protein LOC115451257 [Manduca sexta]|uniref:Uncharacterized protein n=1 Tax=Manduca sexta TaxID=7130 RepID=A0A921ZPS6_MANSE|nr:uncharacterized protein LOC115451257 [Manduca sexta]KAG6461863.1 hypothetical protein O3G_MSEX012904 [Manduca sexta]